MKRSLLIPAAMLLTCAAAHAQGSPGHDEFGTKRRLAFAFHGMIYAIPDTTTRLPDVRGLTPIGTIFTSRLNVPARNFDAGFPGVTDRFEWFAIEYTATFRVETADTFRFELTSDDGSLLFIDEHPVIDNDGIHGVKTVDGTVALAPGRHAIRVDYMQGPRNVVALVLRCAVGNGPFEVFDLEHFGTVQTERSMGKTRYTLGAQTLFDLDKADLRPEADSALVEIAAAFGESRPGSRMVIEGYTDDLGSDAHNQTLSERRADAVAEWMRNHGVAPERIVVRGLGKANPHFPNTSGENRAKNRRVEITVED
jgi:outer membrane protein OmpA-like peptidoglycan-associated protein